MFQALYNVVTLAALVILFIQTKNISERTDDIEYYLSQDEDDDLSDSQ